MTLPLVLLGAGLAMAGAVVFARHLEAASWRQCLKAFRITLPVGASVDDLTAFFTAASAITHRPNWSLLPLPPLVIETVSTSRGVAHVLLLAPQNESALLASLQATLPGVRIQELQDYRRPRMRECLELAITSRSRPLAVDRTQVATDAFLSSLQPMPAGYGLVSQLVITSAGTPSPVKQAPSSAHTQRLTWLIEGEAPIDAEAVSQLRRKYEAPLLLASLRMGVTGPSPATAHRLISRSWSSFQTLNAPGVRLVRRYAPSRVSAARLQGLRLPLVRWPLLLNAKEVAGIAGLPVGGLVIPGVSRGAARQLPAPASLPRRGLVLAHSNYPGQEGRPLALSTVDRLRHAYYVGPTGSGKSWLLANAVLQDIEQQRGTFVIDVKGDLVRDILARVRPADEERIVVIDPSNRRQVVGLNVLQHLGSESSRELVVDNVVHIFRELWHGFWGPRTDWVMRSGLSTLTLARAPGDEQYTLVELSPLLTNAAFRRDLLSRATLPADLALFWQRYDAMSDGERAQVIGPTLNKLDAFTSRTAIRLMLGQSDGIDITDIFTERRTILLALDKGQLGAETTSLLGALSVAALWQATLTRAAVPADQRRPAFAVIDEAQDIVRLPLAIADMLAQARGYGLGITLANQYVAQLSDAVRTAILGTVRTQLAFAVDYDDARILERRFSPLTKDDLQGLQAFEVAIRPSVGGQTLMPVTGTTLPLPAAITDPRRLATEAAARYGMARSDIEAAMSARSARDRWSRPGRSFGRETRRGES
ncbi:hypothetical protein K8Z61_11520 [Nocardioides sp. TRM66260-LWL]|uniref:type IV secretory system conjugative DNA transfer family protein n=1 Tax=Nocardioides sp. TRM66260-LWL TaxID=2874478 RepID=UPI001CC696F5|nr:type IV secretion system DNA-binding domain-containing protein [Nocardioides sp. TRM66260-LWL]MBZ5735126.1 hypothetical protein [Nocardioides sp. TRM66260-LWL]